jgi:hypothetical protein
MVVPVLQLKKGYDRIKRATEERAAVRNAQDQERTRRQISERGRSEKTKQVRLWAYSGPLMVAGFKDFLDLFLIGSSPLVGTVVTICCFLLIFFLFLIKDDLTVRMKPVFLFQAGGALMFATGVEGFAFLLNFLPIGLGIVFGIYFREKQYALSFGIPKKASV